MTAPSLKRILYVDDEADIQEIAAIALELAGDLEVKTCGSGRAALTIAPDFRPDLVMLDVMMPEMDGPITLGELRRLPGFATVPIVFITAKVQPAEVQRFLQLGAADVIAKPFDPMRLADQVKNIWARIHG